MYQTDEEQALFSRRGLYGGFGGFNPDAPSKAHLRSQRQRIDIYSVGACLFLPWLFFCLVYALRSFRLHFELPWLCNALTGVCALVVLATGWSAMVGVVRKLRGSPREPSWKLFVFITMLLSGSLGVILGDLNYSTNVHPYYSYKTLNAYHEVDPAASPGQQFMDGGRVYFVRNASLDLRRSMGFKNEDTYCVAPITIDKGGILQPLEVYDFWAVGLDCCSPSVADFHCGDYLSDEKAHSGLRLLDDDRRAFFRLAVQQAQAAHAIEAKHPLFFYWVTDAGEEMGSFLNEGYKYYLMGMLAHFGWQCLAVGLAAAGFSRLGS